MQASSECISQLILPDIRDLCKIPLFAQFLYQANNYNSGLRLTGGR